MSLVNSISATKSSFEKIPAFLKKTYALIENSGFDDIVSWTENGDAFIIYNLNDFTEKVLPAYFKHKNFSSFVRQLNSYDFHKTKNDNDQIGFSHKLFQRGQIKLLSQIKRKVGLNINNSSDYDKQQFFPISKKGEDVYELGNEHLKLQSQILNLEKKNENLERLISVLVKQNDKQLKETESLWKEINKNKVVYDKKIEKLMLLYMNAFDKPNISKERDAFTFAPKDAFLKLEHDPSFKLEPKQAQSLKYLNKIIKKSANQSFKNSILKDLKSNEKYRKIRMPCEPNDLHASHFYANKRNRDSDIENSDNEEENPEIPNDKKKVKKLKEKTLNLTKKNSKNMQNIANMMKEPNNFMPLYNELNTDKLYTVSPSNLLNTNNNSESVFADIWNKIDNEETCHKKFKGKHGVVSSSFKSPFKMQKIAHSETGNENEKDEDDGTHENAMNNDNEFSNFDDLLENFGIEPKSCKIETKFEEAEEEEEENQVENDFENLDFIDDFNGNHYNEEEGP